MKIFDVDRKAEKKHLFIDKAFYNMYNLFSLTCTIVSFPFPIATVAERNYLILSYTAYIF